MEKGTRVTKKSRTVQEFVSTIIIMVANGDMDIKKTALVDEVVGASITDGTCQAVADVLRVELANLLDNYFSEVVRAASEELTLPYHLTSRQWYKRGTKMPQSAEEARQYVVVFGNGATGKAAGVRFVTADDEPDAMLLVSLSKRMDVVNAAIKTHSDRLAVDLASASVNPAIGRAMTEKLPKLA